MTGCSVDSESMTADLALTIGGELSMTRSTVDADCLDVWSVPNTRCPVSCRLDGNGTVSRSRKLAHAREAMSGSSRSAASQGGP